MRHTTIPGRCFVLAASLVVLGSQSLPALEPTAIATGEHTAPNAQSVAISPDGKLVAAAFGGPSNGRFPLQPTTGGVAVWKLDTGERVSFSGEYGDIVSLQFAADGKSLLYGQVYTPGDSIDSNSIGLIDVATGKRSYPWLNMFRGSEYVVAASPSADQLLVGARGEIGRFTSLAASRGGKDKGLLLEFEDSFATRCAAFSPDGEVFAAMHGRIEPILDATGAPKPSARRIEWKCLTLWDADMLHVRARIVSDDLSDCTAVAVAPHGKWIATGHKSAVMRIWDTAQREPTQKIVIPAHGDARPLFSPDGGELAMLVQGASDTKVGEARELTPTGIVFLETKKFMPVRHWQFADAKFAIWHAGRPAASLNPQRIAYSPDGKQLLIGAGGVSLIDIANGKVVRQFDLP